MEGPTYCMRNCKKIANLMSVLLHELQTRSLYIFSIENSSSCPPVRLTARAPRDVTRNGSTYVRLATIVVSVPDPTPTRVGVGSGDETRSIVHTAIEVKRGPKMEDGLATGSTGTYVRTNFQKFSELMAQQSRELLLFH